MGEIFKTILFALFPPRNPTPERLRQWGFAVAGVLIAMSGLTVANTLVMFGLTPLFGGFAHADTLPGLARSDDVKMVQKSLDTLTTQIKQSQIATLGQQIYNLHVMECNARKAGNAEAARSHADKLEELKFNFRLLAGYDYDIRPCAEL